MTRWDEGMEEKEGEANEIRGRYRRRDFLFLTSGSLKICVYLARRWDVSFDRWETSWLGIFFFLLQVCEIGLVSKGFFPFSSFFFSFLFTVDHSFTKKKWKIINFSSGADRAKSWIAEGRIVVALIESKKMEFLEIADIQRPLAGEVIES